jgi:hypothetical protein
MHALHATGLGAGILRGMCERPPMLPMECQRALVAKQGAGLHGSLSVLEYMAAFLWSAREHLSLGGTLLYQHTSGVCDSAGGVCKGPSSRLQLGPACSRRRKRLSHTLGEVRCALRLEASQQQRRREGKRSVRNQAQAAPTHALQSSCSLQSAIGGDPQRCLQGAAARES